jgi:hypothetical protein
MALPPGRAPPRCRWRSPQRTSRCSSCRLLLGSSLWPRARPVLCALWAPPHPAPSPSRKRWAMGLGWSLNQPTWWTNGKNAVLRSRAKAGSGRRRASSTGTARTTPSNRWGSFWVRHRCVLLLGMPPAHEQTCWWACR